MPLDSHLHRLRDGAEPDPAARLRVRASVMQRIGKSALLEQAKREAEPLPGDSRNVWSGVLRRIDSPQVASVFGRIRATFTPSLHQHFLIRTRLMTRLTPVPVRSSYRSVKWVAAFAVFLLALRISPVIFLAPTTIAESNVMLVPTKGEVEIALHDLWQPVTDEVLLRQDVQLRTGEGEATVIMHDDGTVRLDAGTVIALHDLSNRPEPALDGPTLTLHEGRIWLQGLLPRHLRGLTVSTAYGDITVHAGSVSIAIVENALSVHVWDRHAVVTHGATETVLVAGERARFGEDTAGKPVRISQEEYDEPWVIQNLGRDAVHRREIAQLQQERRAARAGILPTSPLYPVKRVAEKVDVLLTLDPAEKIQKQLDQASTRLDEAAVLLAQGSSGADLPLEEYRQNLIAIASGTGGSSVAQFLLKQEVAENTADLSVAQPNEDLYVLKKALLETSAELPQEVVSTSDIEGMMLVDSLDVLHDAIEAGNVDLAQETYANIEPYVSDAGKVDVLKPDVKKEVLTLLTDAARKLEQTGSGLVAKTDLTEDLRPFLPPKAEPPAPAPLTDEQILALVERVLRRVDVYELSRSRQNQLTLEVKHLKGHYDEGRILRKLYQSLNDEELRRIVRSAIQDLRKRAE